MSGHYFDQQKIDLIFDLKKWAIELYNDDPVFDHKVFKHYGVLKPQLVIAGGYFASLLQGEEPKDFDYFFIDLQPGDIDKYSKAIIDILGTSVTSIGDAHYLNKKIGKVINYNPNLKNKYKKQYIFTDFKSVKELIDHFDYWHCRTYLHVNSNHLYISPLTYECIIKKILIPTDPVNNPPAEWRREKFLARGYKEQEMVDDDPDPTWHMPTQAQIVSAIDNIDWSKVRTSNKLIDDYLQQIKS